MIGVKGAKLTNTPITVSVSPGIPNWVTQGGAWVMLGSIRVTAFTSIEFDVDFDGNQENSTVIIFSLHKYQLLHSLQLYQR